MRWYLYSKNFQLILKNSNPYPDNQFFVTNPHYIKYFGDIEAKRLPF